MSNIAARLGIFARTFKHGSAAEVAADVAAAGYALAHWNFAAIGLQTLGGDVPEEMFPQIRDDFAAEGLSIPSVSCTYNIAHPDIDLRAAQAKDAVRLIKLARLLGPDMVVTLCSGTRDPENQWRTHPDNTTTEAWDDVRRSLDILMTAASDAGVRLGIEPEPANIICDAPTAARLLLEVGEDAPIGIIFDAANLLTPATIPFQREVLAEAISLVGSRVIGAQAKDVVAFGYAAPGAGMMDYPFVLRLLDGITHVPLIVQDAEAADAGRVHADLLRWSAEAGV